MNICRTLRSFTRDSFDPKTALKFLKVAGNRKVEETLSSFTILRPVVYNNFFAAVKVNGMLTVYSIRSIYPPVWLNELLLCHL